MLPGCIHETPKPTTCEPYCAGHGTPGKINKKAYKGIPSGEIREPSPVLHGTTTGDHRLTFRHDLACRNTTLTAASAGARESRILMNESPKKQPDHCRNAHPAPDGQATCCRNKAHHTCVKRRQWYPIAGCGYALLPHAVHDHLQVPRAAGPCAIACVDGAKLEVAMDTRPGFGVKGQD